MSEVTVKLTYDTVDSIVVERMRYFKNTMNKDLANRKSKKGGSPIFSHDKKKDIAEIQKHIDAFNIVLSYYGEKDE